MFNVGLAAAAEMRFTANYYICISNRTIKIEKKGKENPMKTTGGNLLLLREREMGYE